MPAADYNFQLDVKGLEAAREFVSPERLQADLSLIHRKLVFMSLRHAIQTCSVDSGRARAGFLALFVKNGVSAAAAMLRPDPGGSMGRPDPKAMAEGQALGAVVTDSDMQVQVVNGVHYVEYINSGTSRMAGTGFLDLTMLKTLDHAQKVLGWYVETVKGQGQRLQANPDQGPGEIPT